MLVVHATADENGRTEGAIDGDQGNEIGFQEWYYKDWVYYIECLDDEMADRALAFAMQIAKDKTFGYSQPHRWTGYNAIKANGFKIAGAATSDFDCASLVITAYILAGLNIAPTGYTGSLYTIFKRTGKFVIYTDDKHVKSSAYAKRGSMYVRPRTEGRGGHVFMVTADGPNVIRTANTPKPYVEFLGSVNLRRAGNIKGKYVATAHRGDRLPYVGKAPDSVWHAVKYCGETVYTSNKPNLTRLIE